MIENFTWCGRFPFTLTNLAEGIGPYARKARDRCSKAGSHASRYTGIIRVKINSDRTATCTLDLEVDNSVVYTVIADTSRLVSVIGLSRVCDTNDAVVCLLNEIFGCPTPEMLDLEGLVEWAYHRIYGRPMR